MLVSLDQLCQNNKVTFEKFKFLLFKIPSESLSQEGGVGPEIRHFSKPPPLPLSYIPGESEVWPGLGISVGGLNWGETQDNQSWFAAFTLCKKCDHTYSHL